MTWTPLADRLLLTITDELIAGVVNSRWTFESFLGSFAIDYGYYLRESPSYVASPGTVLFLRDDPITGPTPISELYFESSLYSWGGSPWDL